MFALAIRRPSGWVIEMTANAHQPSLNTSVSQASDHQAKDRQEKFRRRAPHASSKEGFTMRALSAV